MARIQIRDQENGHLAFDLIELLEILGDAGVESSWKCVVDDFVPEDFARHLSAAFDLSEHGIPGALLWQIATNTRQVIEGKFTGFRNNDDQPWICLRDVDSSWWEIDAPQAETLWPFRAKFSAVEDIL